MHPNDRSPSSPDPEPSSDATVLRDQREANEQLVLAMLRAHEGADTARAELLSAHEGADTARAELLSAEDAAGVLRVSAAELRSIAELRERLLGIVGHDLRNPLNTIIMASGLLIARGELGEADSRLVHRIVNSGQRMARMIGQLVDFTRARLGGGFALTLEKADLGCVCRNIAEELRIGAQAEIRVATDGDLTGSFDPDRLAEVLSNLASNAVDHATPGTPVLIDAHGDGAFVVATVTNEGAAIPPELLPVIFTAFRQMDDGAQKRSNEHLGLGLYIASEIVRCHGGSLTVRSADGTTTFTMRLPRTPEALTT